MKVKTERFSFGDKNKKCIKHLPNKILSQKYLKVFLISSKKEETIFELSESFKTKLKWQHIKVSLKMQKNIKN